MSNEVEDDDEVYARPVGPMWLVRRVSRVERTLRLRALANADAGKPAPPLPSLPDRFGVSLPRLQFLNGGVAALRGTD